MNEQPMTPPAFTILAGKEILSESVTRKSPADLVIAILSISLCFGLDRVEAAIKNTYCESEASQIRQLVNIALERLA